MELRCPNRKFGVVTDATNGSFEVACRSRECGKRPGVVVLHTFDLRSGELVATRQFADPQRRVNATRDNPAVWSA